jgi:lysophospholipase L1-like esterase
MLREFAEARGIPLLDLLPVLAAALPRDVDEADAATAGGLFLDPAHPSARGSRVVAAAIADFLMTSSLAAPVRRDAYPSGPHR